MQAACNEKAENSPNFEYTENGENSAITALENSSNNNHNNGSEGDGCGTRSENFNVRIMAATMTSVTIDWNLIAQTDVYKIEKFHKRRGWERMAWVSEAPAMVANLEENFAYRMRIRALKFDDDFRRYVTHAISGDFMATTLAAPPTTLCLHRAVKKGQQFVIKHILRRCPNLIEYPGPNGYLPLANAVSCAPNCIIDVLLSHGANVHIGNPLNGRTPLHLAFYYGRLPVARILLNRKASLVASDVNGLTASHCAVDANQHEILKFGLENGADTEATDESGWTLLMRAVVMRADVAILKLLITHGADAKAVDRLGQTCVDLARLYRNEEAAAYLDKALKTKRRSFVLY